MTGRKYPSIAAAIIWSCTAIPALAADFTFVVPVDIANLPAEIVRFRVQCAVATSAAGGIVQTTATDVTVSSGGYRGDVTVDLNVPPARRSEATHYQCAVRDFSTASGQVYSLSGPRPLPRDSSAPFRTSTSFPNYEPIPR